MGPLTAHTATPGVKPGDWCVVNTGSRVSAPIEILEYVSDRASGYTDPEISQWDHAVMCVAVNDTGIGIVEAEPGGARLTGWHYEDRPYKWSTGIITMNAACAQAAVRYSQAGPWGKTGVPYSGLDYAALTLHALHIPFPGLQQFIANSHHMICSQLVDQCAQDGGVHLFDDGRWPGYVKPSDLGFLLVA
jgi:hypothetical protein